MTPTQRLLLERIEAGDCHPYGNNVRVARALAELGFATLEDNGKMCGNNRERWVAMLTDKGREALKAVQQTPSRNSTGGLKTSVHGPNYLVHLPRPGYPNTVWCGLQRNKVNSYPDDYKSPYGDEEEEQTCKNCVKTRAFARAIEPEEVT